MTVDIKLKGFIKTKRMFASQIEHGWNDHLDVNHRLYEAMMHGYTFGVRDALAARGEVPGFPAMLDDNDGES